MNRPETPKDLAFAGYRIEVGGNPDTDPPELLGRYWWTFNAEGMSSVDTSLGDWATPEEAIEDAYQDLVLARADEALGYFGVMDRVIDPKDERQYVLDMIANEMRLDAAKEAARRLVQAWLNSDPEFGGGGEIDWEDLTVAKDWAIQAFTPEELERMTADAKAANQAL